MVEEIDMMEDKSPVLLEDLGMRFPREGSKRKYRYGLYRCGYCGKEWETQTSDIKNGRIKSCGCIINKDKITHGLRHHRLYSTWHNMIVRCYNPTNTRYMDYGGRGITVCGEWLETPTQFIEDMFSSFQEGLSLDRIDNDKGYSKENCRWVTFIEQNTNQRIRKDNTSGYIGVSYKAREDKFVAQVFINKRIVYHKYFQTALEAAVARNNYIVENNLPHKLNDLSSYLG